MHLEKQRFKDSGLDLKGEHGYMYVHGKHSFALKKQKNKKKTPSLVVMIYGVVSLSSMNRELLRQYIVSSLY